jgi:hypothetical protein
MSQCRMFRRACPGASGSVVGRRPGWIAGAVWRCTLGIHMSSMRFWFPQDKLLIAGDTTLF